MSTPKEQHGNGWHLLWARLVLLVLISLLPAIAITLYTFYDLRNSAYAVMQERLVGFVHLAAAEHANRIEGARQFLIALSHISEIRSPEPSTCTETLTGILKENPVYLNIGVVDPEGHGICSALPFAPSIHARDREWFRRALETKGFVVGDYQIGRITGQPSVNVAFPIMNDVEEVRGIIVAAIGLSWLNTMAEKAMLPPATTLTVFDRNFNILIRHPDHKRWVGLNIAHHPISHLMQQRKEGIVRWPDLENTIRLHAFKVIPGEKGLPAAYVRMGLAESAILADVYANLWANTTLLMIGGLLTILVAWLSGRILIGRFIAEHMHVDEMKSEFIALASHQLRTPLTTIRWIIEMFLSGKLGTLTPDQHDLARDADICSHNMAATLRTLLIISQAEAHTLSTKNTSVDIFPLLQKIREERIMAIMKKNIAVTVQCSNNLRVYTDREILHDIISNLMDNAIQYTPNNGKITVRAGQEKNSTHITIADTGYGIPLAEQKRVFTKFFRAKNVVKKQTEGSGLGLYLVYTLVGVLGGSITFSSEENRGTTFSVLLPVSHPSHA